MKVKLEPNYPEIAPVVTAENRPFWSVAIPTYNRTTYLERTLKSILAAEIPAEEMQIEVIDNCSDRIDIERVVRDIAGDRVSVYRQPQTVSMSENWTTCIRRSRGFWVHILHDDDLVLPEFYSTYRQIIETTHCLMVVGQAILIDEAENWQRLSCWLPSSHNLLDNALQAIASQSIIMAASVVVSRNAYEQVGGFHPQLFHAPDWEMWTRIASIGKVGWSKKPYCLYRIHAQSETNLTALQGTNLLDLLAASRLIERHFTDRKIRKAVQQSTLYYLGNAAKEKSQILAYTRKYKAALLYGRLSIIIRPFKLESYFNFLLILKTIVAGSIKTLLQVRSNHESLTN
ncbi:MAG: glycosyltransferase [Cyanobacteria bacterium SBLK]|nr:glycosyltransferase [Cyanobacteria bacterium SBLK]